MAALIHYWRDLGRRPVCCEKLSMTFECHKVTCPACRAEIEAAKKAADEEMAEYIFRDEEEDTNDE